MFAATLTALWAHKRRLLMSALAIVLGVGFVSGTFVLTDALRSSFYGSFATTSASVDAVVKSGHDVSRATLDRLRARPDVAAADGSVTGVVTVVRPDGTPVSSGNMPGMLGSVAADARLRSQEIVRGAAPRTAGQIVLDSATARDAGLAVGDRLRVLGPHDDHGRLYTISGFTPPGQYSGAGVGMTPDRALEVLGEKGYAEVDVAGAGGIGQEELRQRLAGALGGRYELSTGQEAMREEADQATSAARPLTLGLLMFAFVALLVAALVIFNTFQILVAQRMKEMALLRCVGATRRQLFRNVLAESGILGLAASVLGVGAGVGLGAGALAVIGDSLGATRGAGAPLFQLGPSLLAVGLGVLVTVVSAVIPAVRATRIPPIAALRAPEQTGGGRIGWPRIATIAVFGVAGLALAIGGALYGNELGLVAVAAGGCVFFVALLAAGPLYIPPMARLIGALPARAGVPGRLAVANSVRNPGRTAATAAALTIGITLVTLFSVVGASAKASVDTEIGQKFPADYVLSSNTGGSIAPGALSALSDRPEVRGVGALRVAPGGALAGKRAMIAGVSGAQLNRLAPKLAVKGSFGALRAGTVAVSEEYAANAHLGIGDRLTVTTPRAGTSRPRIVALLADTQFTAAAVLPAETFTHGFGAMRPSQAVLKLRPGVTTEQGRRAVDSVLRQYPNVQAQSVAQVREQLSSSVDAMLGVVSGLLGLAIIIAVFGIANTLSLSVFERTRESALVRALGLTKRQLRRMLSVEAGLTAVVGAVLGVLLGIGFGRAVIAALSGMSSIEVFAVSYGQIALFVVIAGACGWLASLLPARRAARASIVSALADD